MTGFSKNQIFLSLITITTTSLWLANAGLGSSEPLVPAKPMALLSRPLPVSIASGPSPQNQMLRQGDRISLNGQILPAPWSQWQGTNRSAVRTGISDGSLMQAMGVFLLNTWDVSRGPVQWFSQSSSQEVVLPAKLTSQYRFLDITDFASGLGWRLRVNGSILEINLPAASIRNIQADVFRSAISSQNVAEPPVSNRIIVDLDRPTPWQVSQQGQEWSITIEAATDSSIVGRFNPMPAPNPSIPPLPQQIEDAEGEATPGGGVVPPQIKVQSSAGRTTVGVNIPANWRPRVWSLPSPPRLLVELQPQTEIDRDIVWAPGLRWRQQTIALGNFRFPVVWLEVNLRQPGLTLKPIWSQPSTLVGTSPLTQMAGDWQAVAAINGGFFNRNIQLPLGAIRRDGRWLSSPILNRGAIAWNNFGEVKIDRLALQESLVTSMGERLTLTYTNSGYIQPGIARYTPDWGMSYTPLTDNEIVIVVKNDRVTDRVSTSVAGKTPLPIPADGYLLAVRASISPVASLSVGTTLRYESVPLPGEFIRYPHIIGAGPLLLKNGQVVLDAKAEQFKDAFIQQAAIRSAIARTRSGTIAIVAIHNRIDGPGPTLAETAELMKLLGAVDALNLDGGSSTSLFLGGRLLDRSPRTAARVHNGLGIFLQPR